MKVKVVVVDDHTVISAMLADYINASERYHVLFTASNGKKLLNKLEETIDLPYIILLDIHMPVMNGYHTMLELKKLYPEIKVVILSMEDEETSIIQFLHLGASGYLLKGMKSPSIVLDCFDKLLEQGYYYPKYITEEMIRAGQQKDLSKQWVLPSRQMEFLKLATQTAKTYKEIAEEMSISIKTLENYQSALFKHFNVKNRPALMLYVQKFNIFGFKKH